MKYPPFPAIKIGLLAVDRRARGNPLLRVRSPFSSKLNGATWKAISPQPPSPIFSTSTVRTMNKNNPFSRHQDHKLDRERLIPLLPEKLPEVSTIDILILDGRHPLEVMKILDNAPHKLIKGEVVQEIANLFRQLPLGEQARCHNPPFGLRFYLENGSQVQCSICWDCNNIYGDFRYNFDGQNSISQSLLTLLKRLSK